MSIQRSINFESVNPSIMNPANVNVYFDASCKGGNMGRLGGGLYSPELNYRAHFELGTGTPNEGEWLTLEKALLLVIKERVGGLSSYFTVYGDSQLVIYGMTGRFRVKAAHLKPIYNRCLELNEIAGASFSWVPREQNRVADKLAGERPKLFF